MLGNKLLISLVLVSMLSACATPVSQVVTQRVEIPIAVPCKVETPVEPDYTFDDLTEESNLFDKVKALLVDRQLGISYQLRLKAALDACKLNTNVQ